MSKKFKVMLVSITLLLVGSIFLGTSYSLWKTSYTQVGTNEVSIGCFTVTFTNLDSYGGSEAGDINLTNSYPITEVAGSALTPYVFKIKNECTIASNYSVNLETLNTSNFNTDYLRVKFNEASNNSSTSVLYTDLDSAEVVLTSQSSTSKALTTGYLAANEEVTYALRTWIDIDATTTTPNVMGASWNGKVVVTSEATETLPKPYSIVSGDLDTVGSVVKIADEEFYVIGQEDSNHVKLLSKWNLNVGTHKNTSVTEGLQDSSIKGYNPGGDPSYGAVVFSWDSYWTENQVLKPEYGTSYPVYVYTNAKSNNKYITDIAEYVENYVSYLNNQNVSVSGRLISKEELENLVNDGNEMLNVSSNNLSNYVGKEWIFSTSYYTGNAYDYERMYSIRCLSTMVKDEYLNGNVNVGVRPVIILEK